MVEVIVPNEVNLNLHAAVEEKPSKPLVEAVVEKVSVVSKQ